MIIAGITMIVGLLILLVAGDNIALDPVKSIDGTQDTVQLTGLVTQVNQREKVIFLTIEGSKPVYTKVIAFPSEPIFVKVGDQVTITGEVEEYQGSYEIIADTIKLK